MPAATGPKPTGPVPPGPVPPGPTASRTEAETSAARGSRRRRRGGASEAGAAADGAPPPVPTDEGLLVPVDIARAQARVRFDTSTRQADVEATVELRVGDVPGRPLFDLRQEVDEVSFDGARLPAEAVRHRSTGAGADARMRAVDIECEARSSHLLRLRYRLGEPAATGANPVDWAPAGDGVRFDLWMSDLEPGRYLEMWLPANLCHDRFSLELAVEVVGTDRPHLLLANGEVEEGGTRRSWAVRYPASYTSLSPMLVLAPVDEVETARSEARCAGRTLEVVVAALPEAAADVPAAAADTSAWLSYFGSRYGDWAHGDRFLAVLWGPGRGMEYDGATTASEAALEHEIFHSWFGRGVKPAGARDGWMDEAMATWATASSRATGARFASAELGLDEAPVELRPAHPWARHTPREAYAGGARLLSGVAEMAGGAGRLRAALADWHSRYGGRAATSDDLCRHLSTWCGTDLRPWWDRYVDGGRPAG